MEGASYSTYSLQAILAVVLLLNISIDVFYRILPDTTMFKRGGVIPFNESRFESYPKSWMQGLAMTSFGSSSGHSMSVRADITLTGVYSPNYCPRGADSCLQLYLSQSPPTLTTLPRFQLPGYAAGDTRKSAYFKMLNTPIYQITVSKALGTYYFPPGSCRDYGYTEYSLVMCATDFHGNGNETSILFGE